MKKALVLLTALALAGCTTNGHFDAGKTALLVGGIAIGALLAEQNSDSSGSNCFYSVRDNSSSQVCR